MGDRGGGREHKGGSLKTSKKNPGSKVAKAKTAPKIFKSGATFSQTPPVPGPELYFDCGAALLSRQFDRDRDRVISRAKTEGNCCGLLIWFSDIEKQSVLADLCKSNSGMCYFATGIHPDNIDRMNKKAHDDWLEKIEEIAKSSECVALLSGLNLNREVGTHFAQESLLRASCKLADKLILPLLLHISDPKSLERAVEILRDEGWTNGGGEGDAEMDELGMDGNDHRVLIHDVMTCTGARPDAAKLIADAGFYCIVAATGLTDADDAVRSNAEATLHCIPKDRLLVCTDSPWKTPQNLSDAYLRTQRNEPANLPSVILAVSEVLKSSVQEVAQTVRSTTLRALGLEFLSQEAVAAVLDNDLKGMRLAEESKPSARGDVNDDSVARSASDADDAAITPLAHHPDARYSCLKCRTQLFTPSDVFTHLTGAATVKTVFKVGDEGLCSSCIFLKMVHKEDLASRTGLVIRGGTVECSECSQKLGKYAVGETPCQCGVMVAGPLAKLNAAKLEYHDGAQLSVEQLVERSRQENEGLMQEEHMREEEAMRQAKAMGGKVKKGKKLKSENKGNFSSYRNKSFVPNASRSGKKGEASADFLQDALGESSEEES